jgi:ABC-type branched-subunit amino acid transport system ATPase component
MVRHLSAVGVLVRTRSASLTRFVRQHARLVAAAAEARAVDRLTRKLQRLARRLDGSDGRTVTAAAAALTDRWFALMDEQRRGGLLELKFLNAHRLTPRSRFEG